MLCVIRIPKQGEKGNCLYKLGGGGKMNIRNIEQRNLRKAIFRANVLKKNIWPKKEHIFGPKCCKNLNRTDLSKIWAKNFEKISEKRTKFRKIFRFLEKNFEKRTKFSEFLPKFAKCSFFEQKEHYTARSNFR